MRAPRVRCGTWLVALSLGLACGAAAPAHAQQAAPPTASTTSTATTSAAPAGADAMVSAKQAWDAGQFDGAELFYKTALDRGGLSPAETVDCYVRLGSARAVLKKTTLARAAFRQAARIDPRFHVPSEAGRRAAQIAAAAKREEARIGAIQLGARMPSQVPAGQPFRVDATLDGKHTAMVAKIGIDARDLAGGAHFTTSDVVATKARFEIPADVATSGATLVVRVDALDAHDNRLASREHRVQVEKVEKPVEAPPATAIAAPSASAATTTPDVTAPAPMALVTPPAAAAKPNVFESGAPPPDRDKGSSHGGFWSTAWPYVIGGVLLASAGAGVYYFTRPTSDVSIGAAHVNAR